MVVDEPTELAHGRYLDTLLVEYSGLREESAQSRVAQQTTFQWSLATFGAIFAGGLIFLGQAPTLNTVHIATFSVVFGIALPTFATFASWAWWGELKRMERIGLYLRALEQHIESQFPLHVPPIQWERFIGWGGEVYEKRTKKTGDLAPHRYTSLKIRIGYIGALGIYVGAATISVALTVALVHSHQAAFNGWAWTIYTYIGVILLLHAGVDIREGRRVLKYPEQRIVVSGKRYLPQRSSLDQFDTLQKPNTAALSSVGTENRAAKSLGVVIVAFSFGQRRHDQEPNPCNVALARETIRAISAYPDAVIYAQWEVGRALQNQGVKCSVIEQSDNQYLSSEDVWKEAVDRFAARPELGVLAVAQPFLQLRKVRALIASDGYTVLDWPVGRVGFDPSHSNTQWWTRGRLRLVCYAARQAAASVISIKSHGFSTAAKPPKTQ